LEYTRGLPQENRSPQESIFLATYASDAYFIDLSFYEKAKPYQLEVYFIDAEGVQNFCWCKSYHTEDDTHEDINYWLMVYDAYTQPLPEGIAGFNTLPKFEKRDAAKQMIESLVAQHWQYIITHDAYPDSFMVLHFQKEQVEFSIKLNNTSPWFKIDGLDLEQIHEVLPTIAPIGIYCDAGFLKQKLNTTHLSLLNEFEQKQVKKWKPETLGDLIFNQWD
jgi:hypothetical protein